MQILKAIKSPLHSYRKVKQYGAGRVVLDQLKGHPSLQWHVAQPIRWGKIAVDPKGYLRRRRLAREIGRKSAYRDYFPKDLAYRVAPPGSFEGTDKIIPVAQSLYAEFRKHFPTGTADGTSFSYLLFDMTKPYPKPKIADLQTHPAFLELACYRPFVEIASEYLGEIPIIGQVDFQVVMPNDRTEGFQKFHTDRIASRNLKIFIAVDDVDEGNGATVIIPADKSAEIIGAIGHRIGRIADERIMSNEWSHHIQHASGPAGTTFFFDTCRNIHCGARTRTRPRLLIMLQYVTKYTYAESFLEVDKIKFDRAQLGGDPVSELLFDVA